MSGSFSNTAQVFSNMKHDLIIKPRDSDYVLGANSPLALESVNNGDWTSHQWFIEKQRNGLFDSDGCACYYSNKLLDVWMDFLMPSFPPSLLEQFQFMGFMDLGRDGLAHFHSSPWFTENLTGNGQNGNSLPECLDVIRKYGAIPYSQFNFTEATTPAQYFVKPTDTQMALGAKFLTLMDGKNFLQYHWLANGSPKNLAKMETAITQSPLGIGIAVSTGWNQTTPSPDPLATESPEHALLVTRIPAPQIQVSDNYIPDIKFLDAGYPINYVLQAFVTLPKVIEQQIISTTAQVVQEVATAPISPADKYSLLTQIKTLLLSIASLFKGQTN